MNAPLSAADGLLAEALAGDRRSLARLLTALENDERHAARLSSEVAARAGQAHVVGITGVPGAGKSTLVNALLGVWLARGERVAVVAIDPASPLTGGAVLGDRVRMGEHGAHPNLFIRSLSARGISGGLAASARAVVDGFDAAGYRRIVVETVGAGQSETAVFGLADTRVVVCPPGLGDEVQSIKAGILEIADVLAVSKGDLPFADRTARDLREMLGLRRVQAKSGARIQTAGAAWAPQVVVVSAVANTGLTELAAAIDAHQAHAGSGQRLNHGRDNVAASTADDGVAERLRQLAAADHAVVAMGIRFVAGGSGRAEVALDVEQRHMNFNGNCHGGVIFMVADTAFGLASNSHGAFAAGIDAHITYQGAVATGDTLRASATEISRGRRIAVYRVDVVRSRAGKSKPVASFTGTVFIQ